MLLTRTQIRRLVYAHGREILEHDHMAIERVCYQHGVVTTFAHSIRVACLSGVAHGRFTMCESV